MSEVATGPQITGSLFLFRKPELLNKEQHGTLGLTRPTKPFAFCASVKAVPLTLGEVFFASKSFPIIFSGAQKPVPHAVLGLIDDVNLFVDADGNWDQNAYIPGYIRRFPFGIAAETGGDRIAIVIDAEYEGMQKNGEVALFSDGEPTPATVQAVEFCKQYESDRRVTEEMLVLLEKFQLVHSQAAEYTSPATGEQQVFAQYFGIDEKVLVALPDDQFLELRKANLLPLIYAQLLSLANWRILLAKRAQRFNLTDIDVTKPLQKH